MNFFRGREHQPFLLNGAGPAAVLVHGFPGSPAEMRPLADVLHGQGWTVQGVLLPGFGPDIAKLGDYSATAWCQAVQEALSNLKKSHQPTIIIGYSLGGALAIQAAAQEAPDGLILLAPFWRLGQEGGIMRAWPFIRRIFPHFQPFRLFKPDFSNPEFRRGLLQFLPGADLDSPEVQQAIRDISIPTSIIDQVLSAGKEAYQVAGTVQAPALILQGASDEVVNAANTQLLSQRLGGPTQVQIVAGAHDLLQPHRPAWNTIQSAVSQFATDLQHS